MVLAVQVVHCVHMLLDALAYGPDGEARVGDYCDKLRSAVSLSQLDKCRSAVHFEVGCMHAKIRCNCIPVRANGAT
jgi:hypothetical protein